MEFWKVLWIVAFVLGFCGFTYISFRVIVRGFAEARSLLGLSEDDPGRGAKETREKTEAGGRSK